MNIYINVKNHYIQFKDDKDKIIKKYSNISTQNVDVDLSSIKLLLFSIAKIELIDNYNKDNYVFYIDNKDIIKYLKDEQDIFYQKVNKQWTSAFNRRTYSELGNLLKQLKKINSKVVKYWGHSEKVNLQYEKELLYRKQSDVDTEIQDILHKIQYSNEDDITAEIAVGTVKKLRKLRLKRESIKKDIKKIQIKEK